jgi:hypothetical protein
MGGGKVVFGVMPTNVHLATDRDLNDYPLKESTATT